MPHDTTEKDIIRLSIEKFRWMVAGEADPLEDLLDKDLIFVLMNGQLQKKRDWMMQLRQGAFNFEKIVPQQMSAQVYSEVAVVFGRATFLVHMHGFPSQWNVIFTEVYALKAGKWKLTNAHSSTC